MHGEAGPKVVSKNRITLPCGFAAHICAGTAAHYFEWAAVPVFHTGKRFLPHFKKRVGAAFLDVWRCHWEGILAPHIYKEQRILTVGGCGRGNHCDSRTRSYPQKWEPSLGDLQIA